MLGLKRHTVKVVDHDPAWAMLGAEACAAVRNACGELLVDVQHVGSTAVPGLPAKPVLDIAAAVATLDSLPQIVRRLTRIGYLYRGDRIGGQFFVAESSPDVRTTHVHVVEHGGAQWRDYLRFRDLLRNNHALRNRYADLKRLLASGSRDDSHAYTASKADFVRQALHGDLDCAGDSGDESRGDWPRGVCCRSKPRAPAVGGVYSEGRN